MVIESFTNPKVRKQGAQKRLNELLARVLKEKNVKAVVGKIQVDNTASILNRTSVKSGNGKGVFKVEVDSLDWAEQELARSGSIDPFTLDVKVSLFEVVENNNAVLDRIRKIQQKLTRNRYNSGTV